ncbi:glycosyltransferase family 1 protein [Paraburkholderia strydomiana]|uniref:glycosyltransferase family 1 protein n=1 Tax=Paraburkholderia strydomiana TaxID=1245417 RepID=UPI0038BD5FAD
MPNSYTDQYSAFSSAASFAASAEEDSRSRVSSERRPLPATLICFSHLRWSFVYQRPQHLLSRMARHTRVHFFEEPRLTDRADAWLDVRTTDEGICIITPCLPAGGTVERDEERQRSLLDAYLGGMDPRELGLWYYSPMMYAFTAHLRASLVVYDCMDELSAFRMAPPQLAQREDDLMRRADVVFTGGQSLYESKRRLHANIHAFPSSVDVRHFEKACSALSEPADQAHIPRPRLGFCGVVDERFDAGLIRSLSLARPDWQFVIVGPTVKIDPADLPRASNIHYLGQKLYDELPRYLGGWDVALMPFALNEATRFISPTKTPEYLAAGRPVVSTAIADVVHRYGDTGVVRIARSTREFERQIEAALVDASDRPAFISRVKPVLAGMSWDATCDAMLSEIEKCVR